ncbi:hypothetical protein LJC45_03415 [Alistipes sp. OttesenSCG-928-B03]|nr:hypothetical protein [Alistipes sp. OttesenSCG-928-B03]
MKRLLIISLFFALWLPAAAQDVRPRVAGLEGNAEYMELLRQEQTLRGREDSLTKVITRLRQEFRENPGDRAAFGNRIIKLEGEIFDVKSRTGTLAGKISEIEQAFIIENLHMGGAAASGDDPDDTARDESAANLVQNRAFARAFSEGDYESLLRAQRLETTAAAIARRYLANYAERTATAKQYEAATTAPVADSIYQYFLELDDAGALVADSLGQTWNYIYDNKLFAYNYMLEIENERGTMLRMERARRDAGDAIAHARTESDSEDAATYFAQKELILDYEESLARILGYRAAADSLAAASREFAAMAHKIPAIDIKERLFIDYEDIAFASPARYNSSHPIPELTVYPRGSIYRVLVGTYSAKQPISVFKGAAPLGWLRQSDGKYAYYAGGYARWADAEKAVADMQARGFRNAKAVVWNNGTASIIDDKPLKRRDGSVITFRVEIADSGTTLASEVRAVIGRDAAGKEIALAGRVFTVGPFETAVDAETLAAAIRETAPSLSVSIMPNE